jgi:hypothetical protein
VCWSWCVVLSSSGTRHAAKHTANENTSASKQQQKTLASSSERF